MQLDRWLRQDQWCLELEWQRHDEKMQSCKISVQQPKELILKKQFSGFRYFGKFINCHLDSEQLQKIVDILLQFLHLFPILQCIISCLQYIILHFLPFTFYVYFIFTKYCVIFSAFLHVMFCFLQSLQVHLFVRAPNSDVMDDIVFTLPIMKEIGNQVQIRTKSIRLLTK